MGNKIKILIFSILFAFTNNFSHAQYSLGGGFSSFHGLNTDINRVGLNAFVELPKANDLTLMVRAAFMFPEKDIYTSNLLNSDFTQTGQTVDRVAKSTYFAVDGGSRYYFINDYDIGFSVYAAPHIKGILASYGVDYRVASGIDTDGLLVEPEPGPDGGVGQAFTITNTEAQYSLLFAFGGTLGVKYQLPYRGALLFDMGIEIVTQLYDPAFILNNEISPLSFSFNVGYRFDWY